jgi:hypothetical protein
MSKLFDECGIDLTNEDHSKLPHLPTVLINGGENRWRDNQSDVLSWAVGREKGQTRATFTMEEGDERLRRYMENMSLLDVFTEDHENQEMRESQVDQDVIFPPPFPSVPKPRNPHGYPHILLS